MLPTLIIVFREVLEAALIVSLVLAATKGLAYRNLWVAAGVLAGLVGAALVAGFAESISVLAQGMGQEFFNAGILFAAVLMLSWHNIWMGRHGREMAQQMNAIGSAVVVGSRPFYALAIVVAVAVLREGSEVVLFLYGIAVSGGNSAANMLIGGLLGLDCGVAAGAALYLGLLRIPMRYLFSVTSWMILLVAAGMASQAAAFLVQAGALPALGNRLWDTTWLLSERSIFGQLLHTMVGYASKPNGMQLVFYVVTLIVVVTLMKRLGGHRHDHKHRDRGERRSKRVAAQILAPLAIGAAGLSMANTARADFQVFSPIVVKGEAELEFQGFLTGDKNSSKDNFQNFEFETGYGVTDNWFLELGHELEKDPGGSLHWSANEIENVFQLLPTGQYWLDVGFYAQYEMAHVKGDADVFNLGPILQKRFGRIVTTANFFFPTEIGPSSHGGTQFQYAVETRYRLIPEFQPGIQAFGNIGPLSRVMPGEQDHRIGPSVFGFFKFNAGTLPLTVNYTAAELFGATPLAPARTFKWILELEAPLPY